MQGFGPKKSLFGTLALGLTVFGDFNPAIANPVYPSISNLGIQALTLHDAPYDLTGRKIALGQVEIGRPGRFGLDKRASWKPQLGSPQLFFIDEPAIPDGEPDDHAGMVAGVMVSRDKRQLGVAPGAKLFASATGNLADDDQVGECLATQHIALQNNQDVRAINFSFGVSLDRDPREEPVLDGNALLSQCLDWTARVYDTLHVVAGNQGSGGIPIPTDHFNGITTSYTTQFKGNEFNKIDFANLSGVAEGIGRTIVKEEINYGDRRAINLTAPGSKLRLITSFNKIKQVSGTSFAAPHITGTVALLQEYGDRQLNAQASNWSLDSRRHQVMKAVLLNSAEKVADIGDGKLLGMDRTILKENNQTWLESDAAKDSTIPLDIEMGTGQLNALRAHTQFAGGQWQPESLAAPIGWNYSTVEHRNHHDYLLATPLTANSYVSVTLAWDRLVELSDRNGNEKYDRGETFRDKGLNDLNVYLLPAGATNISQAVCQSNSAVDSVEHFFCPVPQSGQYKLRVVYGDRLNEATQDYAIAWWTAP